MKSIKLLAAMAIPAMFAACTNEEIVTESPQKMQEVVGAELVGTDISLTASKNFGVQSRFAGGNSGFDKEDKLGLAWVPMGTGPAVEQDSATQTITSSVVYANNMFEKAEGEDMFTTKGNIYKGYHFVYAPYAYEESVGEKTFVVSPKQTIGFTDETAKTETWNKILAKQFQMSGLYYLTANNLDTNNQLTDVFTMRTPLSQLVVKTTAEGVFANNPNLKEYAIKSVKFNYSRNVFVNEAKIDATNLYKWSKDTTKAVNDSLLVASFKDAVINKATKRSTSQKTEIDDKLYKVSDKNPRLVTFVLPMASIATVGDSTKVSVEIEAGGGKFVIAYKPDAEVGSTAAKNNIALKSLMDAYTKDSVFVGKYNQQLTLNLVLTEDDFVAEFTGVNNENWADKVQLANDLGRVNQIFTLEDGANIEFSGNNLDEDGNMLAPIGGVIVKTVGGHNKGKLTIAAQNDTIQWNKLIDVATNAVRLDVAKGAVLKVDSVLTPTVIYNYGTICAGPESTVGRTNYLFNNGRVEVEYGAYVNVGATVGTIAYTLTSSDVENPTQVKEMIATSGTQKGYARVNTLIVGNGIDIDLYKNVNGTEGSTEEGRYNDKVTSGTDDSGSKWIDDLAGVSLEINGGKVNASYAPITVAKVTMVGGTLNNVNTTQGLDVNNGSVKAVSILGEVKAENATINAETITGNVEIKGTNNTIEETTIEGNVTIAEDAKVTLINCVVNGILTNKGTVVLQNASASKITEISNYGTLTSNSDVNVVNVYLYKGSVTTLMNGEEEKTIWYTGEGKIYGGTKTGGVESYDAAMLATAIADAEEGDIVPVNGDVTLNATALASINDGVVLKGASQDIKLTVDFGSVQQLINSSVAIENITIVAETSYTDSDPNTQYDQDLLITAESSFKNVTFENVVAVAADATFENVTFKGARDTYAIWVATHGQKVSIVESTVDAKRGIKVQNDFNSKYATSGTDVETTKLNVSGTTFITEKKGAILADGAVVIEWGEGNDISGVTADKTNAVWVDYNYRSNEAKVVVNGTATKFVELN